MIYPPADSIIAIVHISLNTLYSLKLNSLLTSETWYPLVPNFPIVRNRFEYVLPRVKNDIAAPLAPMSLEMIIIRRTGCIARFAQATKFHKPADRETSFDSVINFLSNFMCINFPLKHQQLQPCLLLQASLLNQILSDILYTLYLDHNVTSLSSFL